MGVFTATLSIWIAGAAKPFQKGATYELKAFLNGVIQTGKTRHSSEILLRKANLWPGDRTLAPSWFSE